MAQCHSGNWDLGTAEPREVARWDRGTGSLGVGGGRVSGPSAVGTWDLGTGNPEDEEAAGRSGGGAEV